MKKKKAERQIRKLEKTYLVTLKAYVMTCSKGDLKMKDPKVKGFLYTIENPENGDLIFSTDFEYSELKSHQGYNVYCRMYVYPDITVMCHGGSC